MANSTFNLSDLNGTNGFAINGINPGDLSGNSVSSAGDINSDGIDDLIIGAFNASPNGYLSGKSYVVFGSKSSFSAQFNLSTLNGTNGFAINGINQNDRSGNSVSSAGDINSDGIDDLIIGADGASPNGYLSGKSYVVFGSKSSFSAQFNLSTLNGTNGFAINGINQNDRSGNSVSSAGDINSDGIDDLIIGADGASPNGYLSGKSYVVFGSKSSFSAQFNLSTLNGTNGFAINGIYFDDSGRSVSSAGDINGDGIDDLIIGADGASPNGYLSGKSYVVFGSKSGFSAQFNLSTLNGTNGFAINGIYFDDSGRSVSSAGDINGDGIDDLIIGADGASPNGYLSGKSYVVFGSKSGFSAQFNLSTLNGTNGFAINGINQYDRSGGSVSSAGDINGDGIDDLIIGADGASPNGVWSGQSYVLFGSKNIGSGSTPILTGTAGTDTLIGTIGNNIIDGKAGNDTLTGNGGQDKFVFRTGDGNDTITDFGGVGKGSFASATLTPQVDTLEFTGAGLTAKNLQLTQNGNNLEVTFEDTSNIKVILENFKLENLDNLPASGNIPIGNILFDGHNNIADSFDILEGVYK